MLVQTESEQVDSSNQAEQQLRQMNEEWVAAAVSKDLTTLNRLMHDRCIFTDALTGDDKAQFLGDIEAGHLQIDVLNRENVEVRIYGDTGVMTSLDSADWHYNGRHLAGTYRTIHVYAKGAKGWQIVAIQSSRID
jgi:ketosteroid isomerase-like protein